MGTNYSAMADEEREDVKRLLREAGQPINILLVGLPGCGKSSLVMSLEACVTKTVSMDISTGLQHLGSTDLRLRKYRLFKDTDDIVGVENAPCVFEVPGFLNYDNQGDMLKSVLLGHVGINEIVPWKGGTVAGGELSQRTDVPENKIDRVIFVHPSFVEVPENLIDMVRSVCTELDITLYSVLTWTDEGYLLVEKGELGRLIGTHDSMRECEVELYHRSGKGRCVAPPVTDLHLLRLWRALLNVRGYRLHSSHANPKVYNDN